MKANQKGFGFVEILIVIVVVGVLGAVGWLVYDRQKSKTSDTPNTQVNTTQKEETPKKETEATKDPYADWETASFELAQASFKYPKSLKMAHEVKADASSNTGFETYTLTAGDNTKISLIAFHFLGGFTGDEPKYLIEDVITGTDKTNNREFSSIIYKNSNGVYDTAYVMDSTQTKYKAGQESQIFINSFGVKPKGANTARSQFSISVSGQKYQTYKTLAEIRAMGAYKDIEKFLNALNIPSNE
jgi:prepilin-type N-terminal cleavage/methylation domain-containing protein